MNPSQTTSPAAGAEAPLPAMQQAILDIRSLRARLKEAEKRSNSPVAIVGMACRVPGADDTGALWQLLADGVDAVGEMPQDRWDVARWYDPDPDAPAKMSTRFGGFLTNVDSFDAEFFGISDREAISVDPQHRLLLEVGWSAFEDAGFAAEAVFGSRTGVFVGISSFDYASLRAQTGDLAQVDAYHATGISHSAGAGRLSYYFGLNGPAISIDTACSSSLVALHLACQSLRANECDAALAGGINLILSPEIHITLSKARMLARDGRCKAFDAAADGFVRSEGCGMLVLKRLDDAIRDGDRIHAVVRGSACNQDGRSSGLSAPNGPSQTAVIEAAWSAAGVAADEIDYVEAHGTGTALGDPIEAGALAAALKGTDAAHVLAIGSVKSNLGHMEAAAGVGGVIKTALALRHEEIPASLHFKRQSPNIDWSGSRLKVVAEPTAWPRSERPRLAGISSFGFSGTNVHVVIEEAPPPPAAAAAPETRILAISAMNDRALAEVATRLAGRLRERSADLQDWSAFTRSVNARRTHFAERAALVVTSPDDALRGLDALAVGQSIGTVLRGRADAMRPPTIALAAGAATEMQADPREDELYTTSRAFREVVDACTPAGERGGTVLAESRAFTVQLALAQTWREWLGEPVSVRGDGVGALVAACVAGALSVKDAAALVEPRRAFVAAADDRAAGALAAYRTALAGVSFAATRLQAMPIDADYWLAEAAAVRAGTPEPLALGNVGSAIVIELGAGPNDPASPFACGQAGVSLRTSMLHAAAALYVRGAAVDWRAAEEPTPGRAFDLPGYPWTRRPYWFPRAATAIAPSVDWSAMAGRVTKQADQVPIDMRLHDYPAKYRALARLSTAYIVRTLSELGALAEPDTILSAEALVTDFGVQPIYSQLMDIWLNTLVAEDVIARDGASYVTNGLLLPRPVEPYLADAESLFAEETILLDYVRGCGALLTQVITGMVPPLETLFPKGSIELAERIYHQAALSRYFNGIAAAAAGAFAAGQAGAVRAIEIGGGTGGVTGSILAALPAERARYTFTDVSGFFFEPAAKRFNAFDFLDFAVLDIERDPASQGFEPRSYDLVVAANVLHATADLGQTLDFVRSLLAPGGALLLYEVTHPPAYFDISIALIEGWQKSSDNIRDIGPLIDTDKWLALLAQHGFEAAESWPRVSSPAEALGSHVFMARATGQASEVPAVHAPVPSAAITIREAIAGPADDVLLTLADAPDSEHLHILIEFVRRRVGIVLKRPEGSDIPADRRLMDLGLDSLMALELRNSLAKGLGLEQSLPTTLMFDYPSIADIAGYLLGRMHEDERVDMAQAPIIDRVPELTMPAPAGRVTAETIDELSDADVELLLAERLNLSAGDQA